VILGVLKDLPEKTLASKRLTNSLLERLFWFLKKFQKINLKESFFKKWKIPGTTGYTEGEKKMDTTVTSCLPIAKHRFPYFKPKKQ